MDRGVQLRTRNVKVEIVGEWNPGDHSVQVRFPNGDERKLYFLDNLRFRYANFPVGTYIQTRYGIDQDGDYVAVVAPEVWH